MINTIIGVLFGGTLFACDVCGSFFGVTPYDNQSGFSIQHRYRLFSKVDVAGQPFFPSGAYRLPQAMSTQHIHGSSSLNKGDFESFKVVELRGKWFVHQRVEVNFILPFGMTRSVMGGEMEKINGFGDPTVSFGFHILRPTDSDIKQRLITGAGVKLPLGKDDLTMSDGERFHLYMQPGTGSTDVMAYVQYSIGIKRIGGSVNASGKYSGTNSFHEQLSPSFTGTANFFYVFRKGNTIVLPQLQMYGEYMRGMFENGVEQSNSKMSLLMAGAGCDAYFGQLGVHLSGQLPLMQYESNQTPGASLRAIVGLSWNINQQKFLIN